MEGSRVIRFNLWLIIVMNIVLPFALVFSMFKVFLYVLCRSNDYRSYDKKNCVVFENDHLVPSGETGVLKIDFVLSTFVSWTSWTTTSERRYIIIQ